MKKTIFGLVTIVAFFAFSCQNADKKTESTEETTEQVSNNESADTNSNCAEHVSTCTGTMTVDSVLNSYKDLIGQEITVCGNVTHVCQHSGLRMFLAAENSEDIIIITGEEKFPEENMGQKVIVTGKVTLVEDAPEEPKHEGEEINDDQHKASHKSSFVIEATECKICKCDHSE